NQSNTLITAHSRLDEEERFVKQAVAKRRNEFITGRYCLRSALAAFGRPLEKPISVGHCRAPALEPEYVGTISHCDSYVVAAAGRAKQYRGIGIDVEKNTPLEPGLERLICTPNEIAYLNTLSPHDPTQQHALPGDPKKLIFSIKESFYKAYFKQVGCYFDFQDAEVELSHEALSSGTGACQIRLLHAIGNKPFDPRTYSGYFLVRPRFLYTAVVISTLHLVE
ncbi:MAG: 4'-phosphopantetheinyl transferase superfamily protein, partial [Gammaproteobacteria bacterium]